MYLRSWLLGRVSGSMLHSWFHAREWMGRFITTDLYTPLNIILRLPRPNINVHLQRLVLIDAPGVRTKSMKGWSRRKLENIYA